MEFVILYGHTLSVVIRWDTLQGDPLSPPLFDLMVVPLIRWLTTADKAYDIASSGIKLANRWYDDDGTPVTNSVDDMIFLLDIV